MNGVLKNYPTTALKPGMMIGVPVKTPSGQIIARPGVILTAALITRFEYYKVPEVQIFEKISQDSPVPEASGTAEVPQAASAPKKTVAPLAPDTPVVFKNTVPKKETTLIKQTDKIVAPSRTGGTANPTYSQQIKSSPAFQMFETSFAVCLSEIIQLFADVCEGTRSIDCTKALDAISGLFGRCRTSIDLYDMIHNMRQNNDTVYAHCLNVSLIVRQMGIWLKLSKEDTDILTLAGLFHDIGKLRLPPEILTKVEKLTDKEFALIRKHPEFSYDILKTQNIDDRIKIAALQHHERCDGSGYPFHITGSDLHAFSQIIAIADVYDAMTAARAYRSPLCPFQVIHEFEKDGLQKFNPKFILTFLENIAKTYQNNRVLLNNGVSANIVLLNSNHLSEPIVQLNDGSCIDLSASELFIKALI